MKTLKELMDDLDDLCNSLVNGFRGNLRKIGRGLSEVAQRFLRWQDGLQRSSVIAALLVLLTVVLTIGGLLDFYTNAKAVGEQIFPSPTSTATLFPSHTPVPTQTPTNTPTITPTPNATQLFLATHVPTLNAVFEPVVRTVDGIEQVWTPAGAFTMGDHFDDGKGFEDEDVHSVYTNEFWIDRFLVTTQQFSECPVDICGNPAKNDSHKRPEGYYNVDAFDDYPVIEVIWDQANAYCAWRGGRLPTEAEWEKAAGWNPATGETGLYPWGDEPPNNVELASFDRVDLDTSPVDAYPAGASPVGAYHMAGNVWQYTADWYDKYLLEIFFNPTGPVTGKLRVVRGGSWADRDGIYLRVANRGTNNPGNANNHTGFRCVYDIEDNN